MRALTIALLLPLSALAQDGEVVYATDRGLFRKPPELSEEACPRKSDSIFDYVVRGEAEGLATSDVLIKQARRNALEKLEPLVCEGIEDTPRCLVARRHIKEFGNGEMKRQGGKGWACASVAVDIDWIDSKQKELDRMGGELAALAGAIREKVENRSIKPMGAVWARTGCTAGESGTHLQLQLRRALAGAELVGANQPARDAVQVRLELSLAVGEVSVAVGAREPGQTAWSPLGVGGFDFPAHVYALEAKDADYCFGQQGLGLAPAPAATTTSEPTSAPASTTPAPPPGPQLRILLDSEQGVYCEGERVQPRVELSAPARLRLYSVDGDGTSWRIWPWNHDDDVVYGPSAPPELPGFDLTLNADGSDSTLVVVAFPADLLPSDPPRNDMCTLRSPLDVRELPGFPAVDMLSLAVLPAGERLCLDRGDASQRAKQLGRAESAERQYAENYCESAY